MLSPHCFGIDPWRHPELGYLPLMLVLLYFFYSNRQAMSGPASAAADATRGSTCAAKPHCTEPRFTHRHYQRRTLREQPACGRTRNVLGGQCCKSLQVNNLRLDPSRTSDLFGSDLDPKTPRRGLKQ